MDKYICPRCEYSTNYITNFKKHITSKNICYPKIADVKLDDILQEILNKKKNNSHECEYCNKLYSSNKTLKNHYKTCKQKNDNKKLNESKQNDNNITISISILQNEIKLLKEKLENQKPVININTQNNLITNFNSTNEFLQEDISYLNDEFMIRCAKKLNNGLIDFIQNIRFNQSHPENMNVRIHRIKQKTLYVFQENRWKICDAKCTLEDMIIHGVKILHQKILTHFDQEKLMEQDSSEYKVHQWLLSLLPRTDEKNLGILSKRLYAMILDNQLLIMEQNDNLII